MEADVAGPTTRLMISHMEMENFKSYQGKRTIGPFHKCFSSVVGPNGSGKSNVIDAMLFVFGFRATKIRQGKLSGLIHSSESHRNIDKCAVTVFFQMIVDHGAGDDFEVVPGSEVTVRREARSDNTSTYRYNGKVMVFKEIAVKLRELGIDLDHNRFLILQGEVEAISMMPPKGKTNEKGESVEEGMLEYLEDIIGSNKFVEPIKEAETKVETLNEDRSMKLGNVKIVEKEKDNLEGAKNEAEEHLALINEVTVKKNLLYQAYVFEYADAIEEKKAARDAAKATFDEANALLAFEEKEVKKQEEAHNAEMEEYKALKKATEAAKAEFSVFERKDVQLRENVKHGKAKVKKLEKSIESDRKEVGETIQVVNSTEQDMARFDKERAAAEKDLVVEDAKLDGLKEECKDAKADLKGKLETAQSKLAPYVAAVDEAQSKVDILQQELDLLNASATAVATQLAEAETNLAKAEATGADRASEIDEIKARQKVATIELAKTQKDLAQISKEEGPLTEEVKSQRSRVEEVRSASGKARSQNKVFSALMALKRKGVYGRLGDLGTIDDKYDCAITTACSALNMLVVDTVSTGQWCINYLKEKNIGRVTIICMDKQVHLQSKIRENFTAPSGTDRLFDLIRPKDDMFLPAFYFGVRNTLVAKDLKEATKVAYEGRKVVHRVVTIAGQLIDTSGTMSGGGAKAQTGGMSSSIIEAVTPQEIARMEAALEVVSTKLTNQRQARSELQGSVTSLTKELASVDVRIKKCEMDVAAAEKVQPQLREVIVELKEKQKSIKSDAKQQAAIEKNLAAETKVLNEAKAEASVVEEEVKAVEKAIEDVGGVRLKAQKAKVKSLNSKVDTLRSKSTKASVDCKTARSKVTKLEKKIAKETADIEEQAAVIAKIKAELSEMEDGALTVMSAYKEAQQVLEEKEESMKVIEKSYRKLEASISKARSTVVDLEEELKVASGALKAAQSEQARWIKELKKLKLHKIGSDYFDEEDDEGEGETNSDMPAGTNSEDHDALVSENPETTDEAEPVAIKVKRTKKFALDVISQEDSANLNQKEIKLEIALLEEQINQGKTNTKAIKEYYEKEEQYIAKVAELDAVTEERDQVRAVFEGLRKERLDLFFDGFKIISTKLKEMYQMITLGGDAELEYVDNINPFSEGIVFSVRPPRKSWKAIQNLSGGEKTLSSLALVFALHHFKPTPLYVMDEIDAALDFKNVSIVAHYIKERTKNAQFVIISLRNNMFELADRLVGIYKTDNCTKSVTINPHALSSTGTKPAPVAEKTHEAAVAPLPIPMAEKNV